MSNSEPNLQQCDDAELVAACIAEETGAKALLFEIFFTKDTPVHYWVYGRAYWISLDDKEDILNDVFIAVVQSLPSFGFKSTLKTYISRIAKMKCLDAMPTRMSAASGKGIRFVDTDERNPEGELVHQIRDTDSNSRPDRYFEELHEAEQVRLLHTALAQFSGPRCKLTLSLYIRELNEEISREELAEALGVSETRAQNMIYDCMYRLRKRIRRYYQNYSQFSDQLMDD